MKRLFLTFYIILLFVSCINEENSNPQTIFGTWEKREYNEFSGLDDVLIYIFNENGTYAYYSVLREEGGIENLGYTSRSSGNFRIENGRIFFTTTETLAAPMVEPIQPGQSFYTLDELDDIGSNPNDEYSRQYELRKNGEELFLTDGGARFVGDASFIRVE